MTSLKVFIGDGGRFANLEPDEFLLETSYTHADCEGSDHTLCGETLDGDKQTAGSFKTVKSKYVTCPICVKIIKYCKTLKVKP